MGQDTSPFTWQPRATTPQGYPSPPPPALPAPVQMKNEEEIADVQISRELFTLGWIHTHPTQSCFLSSVDVHTHCPYQTMLDEAIAIVMAPRDPKTRIGIFRLSVPGGLKLVQCCALRGFHTHPPTDTGQPLYELCNHVYLNPRTKFEVIDLR